MIPLWRGSFKYKVFVVDTIDQELLDEMSKDYWDLSRCFVKWNKIHLIFKKRLDD